MNCNIKSEIYVCTETLMFMEGGFLPFQISLFVFLIFLTLCANLERDGSVHTLQAPDGFCCLSAHHLIGSFCW